MVLLSKVGGFIMPLRGTGEVFFGGSYMDLWHMGRRNATITYTIYFFFRFLAFYLLYSRAFTEQAHKHARMLTCSTWAFFFYRGREWASGLCVCVFYLI